MQKQPPEKFCKIAVLKKFEAISGKHLCWSLFLIQSIAKSLQSTYFEEHLQKAAFDNEKEEYRRKIIDLKNIFPNISQN